MGSNRRAPSLEHVPQFAREPASIPGRHAVRGLQGLAMFISYCHADVKLMKDFVKCLSPLVRQGLIAPWSDREVGAGREWNKHVLREIEEADLIVLLVSSAFIASDWCWRSRRRAPWSGTRGKALVIPVILKKTQWRRTELGRLQALPEDGRPVTSWSRRDDGWDVVAEGIGREWRNGSRPEGRSRHRPARVVSVRPPAGRGSPDRRTDPLARTADRPTRPGTHPRGTQQAFGGQRGGSAGSSRQLG